MEIEELDSISVSTFGTRSGIFSYNGRASIDYRHAGARNASGQTKSCEKTSYLYKHVDRSWDVCYVTTVLIIVFYLSLWYYFETGRCRFCSRQQ